MARIGPYAGPVLRLADPMLRSTHPLAFLAAALLAFAVFGGGVRARPPEARAQARSPDASPAAPVPAQVREHVDEPPGALDAFRHALARVRAAGGDGIARVMFLGDSAVVGDEVSGELRRALQERYGDAGHGFLLPGKPWPWYRHRDARHDGHGWHYVSILHPFHRPDLFGFGFMRGEARGRAVATVGTDPRGVVGRTVGHFEVWYMKKPGGGSFTAQVDGDAAEEVHTAAAVAASGYLDIDVPDGPHELTVKTEADGPVDLFGIVMERHHPGVVVDAIGINGAQASNFIYNDASLLAAQMRHRKPDLFVLQVGTNYSTGLTTRRYADFALRAVQRLRRLRPQASCLILSPPDRLVRQEDGTLLDAAYIAPLARKLRDVAHQTHCAYWDAYSAMGGAGSFARWQGRGLARDDGVHLNRDGDTHLADLLVAALLEDLQQE